MKARTILTALGVAILLGNNARASQEQLATSIKEARVEAGQTRDQLKATLAALNTLAKQGKGDLRPAYEAFCAEIPKTEAAAAATHTRVVWMLGDGFKYFDDWQKTIEGINNKGLKKHAQKRLDATKKIYAKVAASLQEAGEKFKPFLADLSDIKKVLANDVTANGVKGVHGTVADTNWRFKAVNKSINNALEEMKEMEKALSTEAK